MTLITKEIEIEVVARTAKHFEDKGYKVPRWKDKRGRIKLKQGTKIRVKINDLPKNSLTKIDVKCDCCGKILKNITWRDYNRYLKEDGAYYCLQCSVKLYGIENYRKARIEKGKSFKEWCIENNRDDVLDRWDYQLNEYDPENIGFSPRDKYYFKCPKKIHESEQKSIGSFTGGSNGAMVCRKCNSIGQYIIDNFGEELLWTVWSDKNEKSPFEYSYGSNEKIWWECINEKHNDYPRTVVSSKNYEFRCPSCEFSKGEKEIEKFLIDNKIEHESQKSFRDLLGLRGGLLSYDFYLSNYNLLIEYQGQYHDGTANDQTEEEYRIQQEHDKRKREYAKLNNINLLEIWYWDFDRIREIIKKLEE